MEFTVDNFIEFLAKLELPDLQRFQSAIQSVISNKISVCPNNSVSIASNVIDENSLAEAGDYVDYNENFIDTNSRDLLSAEIKSLNFVRKTSSTALQNRFLSGYSDPYVWSSQKGPVVNNPLHIDNYPVVKSIMAKINETHKCNLNSVLVSYYINGATKIGLHDDSEETIDSSQPICVLSLGNTRRVEFVNKKQDSYRSQALILDPVECSLYTMKAGCQKFFMHRVKMDKRIKGERISLSFRCFIPTPKPTLGAPSVLSTPILNKSSASETSVFKTPNSDLPEISPITSKNRTDRIVPAKKLPAVDGYSPYPGSKGSSCTTTFGARSNRSGSDEKICLLFGTSITQRVDGAMMSKGSRTVVNNSYSGANIKDITEEVEAFHNENPRSISNVDKIIFCVGTNEIKWFNCRKYNVYKCFRTPLVNLMRTAKCLFPHAQVIFQCVLPIRVVYNYTGRSVELFNNLLFDVCREFGCIYYDECFEDFLGITEDRFGGYWYMDYNANLYRDNIHLNGQGLKLLCRALKFAIYRNLFNPLSRFRSHY